MAINFGNWDAGIHDEFEQVKRMESGRKLAKDILQINTEEGWVEIQGSAAEPYHATLDECECVDFEMRGLPCKHIYCLAFEMGKMDGLPVYKKKKSSFDKDAEIERYKALYTDGEITADAYVKICSAIAKLKK